ncbi:hypothetical protein HDU92_005279 [Lobulomyces angularis]|nr:hypothetical protein HDU92_005279 [Lobulomyces angularis]
MTLECNKKEENTVILVSANPVIDQNLINQSLPKWYLDALEEYEKGLLHPHRIVSPVYN